MNYTKSTTLNVTRGTRFIAVRAVRGMALATVSLAALQAGAAYAQTAPAAAPATTSTTTTTTAAPAPAAAPAAPWKSPTMSDFLKSIKYSAVIEGGASYNPQRPPDAYNFGQLFTDRANTVQLNQALFTVERDMDPAATDYDFGFKLQGLYGSDARYVHYLGEFTHVTQDRYQPMILEADVSAHLPWGMANGVDLKVGQFPTPEGNEVIPASGNAFYTHSYIFNYGLPFVATGALAIVHATSKIDIYLEADTGLNTTFGNQKGDDNAEPAGLAGFNLTLMGGNLTALVLSHFGPEDATRIYGEQANHYWRYLNDAVITWKATPKLTLVTDVNYSREDHNPASVNNGAAEAYGAAEYASYPLTDTVTFNARGEVFRDNNNFFVGTFPGSNAFTNAQLGLPVAGAIFASKPTTYSELTVGLSIAPKMPAPVASLTFRPEIRYDRSLNDSRPYANGNASGGDKGQLTAALDVIVGF